MKFETEILVIGGGLAGLTAALHLQKVNLSVTLIEKNVYPHHKVCGEYVSNEVLPYLAWLGISLESLGPTSIKRLQLSSQSGASLTTSLTLGGFGLSRFVLDDFLYRELLRRKVDVLHDTVCDIDFDGEVFTVTTAEGRSFKARQVLGAFGKRATIDARLDRDFIRHKSPYMAVKAHYRGPFSKDLVGLHHFNGGYCGISKVEDEKLNICYLANYESFKRYKNIKTYEQGVLYKNKFLREVLESAEMIGEAPMVIGQISFQQKEPVVNHILMIGDTAGLIHPLCGNGMAMAMHSAKMAAELVVSFLQEKSISRVEMETKYAQMWKATFGRRLMAGRMLSSVLSKNTLQRISMQLITKVPSLLSGMIKMTHGKPIPINKPCQ